MGMVLPIEGNASPFLFSPPTPSSLPTPPLPPDAAATFGGSGLSGLAMGRQPSVESVGLDSPRMSDLGETV